MLGDRSLRPVDATRADDELNDGFGDFEEDDELDDEDLEDDEDDEDDAEEYEEYEEYYRVGDDEPRERRRRQEWE